MEILHGNAIVGQSGGPTTAINATLAGVISGAMNADCIDKVYGMRNGIDGIDEYWKKPLNGKIHTSIFGVGTVNIEKAVDKTLEHMA